MIPVIIELLSLSNQNGYDHEYDDRQHLSSIQLNIFKSRSHDLSLVQIIVV